MNADDLLIAMAAIEEIPNEVFLKVLRASFVKDSDLQAKLLEPYRDLLIEVKTEVESKNAPK